MTSSALQETVQEIVRRMDLLSAVRDRALTEGRQVIRLSANTVRAVHRGEFDEATALCTEARTILSALTAALALYPSLLWAGYVQDAMKECAEASLTLAIVRGGPLPTPATLGIEDAPYLNALAEGASELRRQVLDRLRGDDVDRAVKLVEVMDEIYDALVTVDFPDAITGGLRRTTDQLRAVLERTRGDVTMTLTQRRLRLALQEATGSQDSMNTLPGPEDDSDDVTAEMRS